MLWKAPGLRPSLAGQKAHTGFGSWKPGSQGRREFWEEEMSRAKAQLQRTTSRVAFLGCKFKAEIITRDGMDRRFRKMDPTGRVGWVQNLEFRDPHWAAIPSPSSHGHYGGGFLKSPSQKTHLAFSYHSPHVLRWTRPPLHSPSTLTPQAWRQN